MRAECVRAVEELALRDPQVVVIASDPASGFMSELATQHPDRRQIEGVSEQGIVGMAAGLASEGFYPFMFMLAVFGTRRCYEQLLLDFGMHGLAGCVVGTGGGLAYAALGPTHIAVDDLMLVSAIPGSAVMAPAEPAEAIALAHAARNHPGLSFLRLGATTKAFSRPRGEITLGKGRLLEEAAPNSVLFVSCGSVSLVVESAVSELRERGINAALLHLHTVKPLDQDLVRDSVKTARVVICVEEHRQVGGLATAVLHALTTSKESAVPDRFTSIGVDDGFPFGYGSYEEMLGKYGMLSGDLSAKALELIS